MKTTIALSAIRFGGGMLKPKSCSSLAKYLYIKQLLETHDISLILDVGANEGQFAEAMRALGYRGRIVSFEPVKRQFDVLRRKTARDGRWDVYPFALGDKADHRSINVMASSVFSSFMQPDHTSSDVFAGENEVADVESVEIRTLAEVLEQCELTSYVGKTFLKCDTQGFDLNVLHGARTYLHEMPLLQVELSVVPIYQGATSMTDMIDHLSQSGFNPVACFPINAFADGSAIELDYICVNRGVARSLGTVPANVRALA